MWPRFLARIWNFFFEIWRQDTLPGVVENVTLPLPLSHFFLPVVENGTLEGKPIKKVLCIIF